MNERDAQTLANVFFQTDFGIERILDMDRERLLEAYADLIREFDVLKQKAEAAGVDLTHPMAPRV